MTPQAKAAATRRRNRAIEQLDGRDREVFDLLPSLTNEEIAERLGCHLSSVERAISRLREKLEVGSRVKLARLASPE